MSVDWFNVFLQAAFRFLHAQGRGFPGTELAYDHACGLPGRFPVREGHLARESGDEGLVYDNGIAAAAARMAPATMARTLVLSVILVVFLFREKFPHVVVLVGPAFPGEDKSPVVQGKAHCLAPRACLIGCPLCPLVI